MVLRYWYVIRSSWPRTAELIYWPLVQMLMWGFLQGYLATATTLAGKAAGLFIGAVLLWDILVRSQLGFSFSFLEEVWARNLASLYVSPLRPLEHVVDVKPQLVHNHFAWRRSTEMIQADDGAGSTHPFVPIKSRASLNCQRGNVERQNRIPVLDGLLFE